MSAERELLLLFPAVILVAAYIFIYSSTIMFVILAVRVLFSETAVWYVSDGKRFHF